MLLKFVPVRVFQVDAVHCVVIDGTLQALGQIVLDRMGSSAIGLNLIAP